MEVVVVADSSYSEVRSRRLLFHLAAAADAVEVAHRTLGAGVVGVGS